MFLDTGSRKQYTFFMSTDLVIKTNPYLPLVPEATAVLRQIMHTSQDEKVKMSIAKDILTGAGVTKDQTASDRPILIKDSQVQLLIQVAKEVSE